MIREEIAFWHIGEIMGSACMSEILAGALHLSPGI